MLVKNIAVKVAGRISGAAMIFNGYILILIRKELDRSVADANKNRTHWQRLHACELRKHCAGLPPARSRSKHLSHYFSNSHTFFLNCYCIFLFPFCYNKNHELTLVHELTNTLAPSRSPAMSALSAMVPEV